jgi:tRNA nucleotidyltransferase/poly(A) polymerase
LTLFLLLVSDAIGNEHKDDVETESRARQQQIEESAKHAVAREDEALQQCTAVQKGRDGVLEQRRTHIISEHAALPNDGNTNTTLLKVLEQKYQVVMNEISESNHQYEQCVNVTLKNSNQNMSVPASAKGKKEHEEKIRNMFQIYANRSAALVRAGDVARKEATKKMETFELAQQMLLNAERNEAETMVAVDTALLDLDEEWQDADIEQRGESIVLYNTFIFQ